MLSKKRRGRSSGMPGPDITMRIRNLRAATREEAFIRRSLILLRAESTSRYRSGSRRRPSLQPSGSRRRSDGWRRHPRDTGPSEERPASFGPGSSRPFLPASAALKMTKNSGNSSRFSMRRTGCTGSTSTSPPRATRTHRAIFCRCSPM